MNVSVLFVVSEIGFTWEEVLVPFSEFQAAGLRVVISTIHGQQPKVDPLSIKIRSILSSIGLGISPSLGPVSKQGKSLQLLLDQPLALKAVASTDFAAIYIAGGHGSLFDINKDPLLHKLILEFDTQQKPIGVLCHASSTLCFVQKNGALFTKNRNITGFPTLWEQLVLRAKLVSPNFLPLPFWTGEVLNKYATGRTLLTKFQEIVDLAFTVQDGKIISGVGPKAGRNVARKMINSL